MLQQFVQQEYSTQVLDATDMQNMKIDDKNIFWFALPFIVTAYTVGVLLIVQTSVSLFAAAKATFFSNGTQDSVNIPTRFGQPR